MREKDGKKEGEREIERQRVREREKREIERWTIFYLIRQFQQSVADGGILLISFW